jgi:FkbM family methyltransferase
MPEFWDEIVDGYEMFIQQCGRADAYLSKIRAWPDSTVLDIGAGHGTLAIPLAKKVKAVTVVEPSQLMLARLKENAAKEGLGNLTYVHKKWEDVKLGEDVMQTHDVVITSHSLFMENIESALAKMNDATKRSSYIFMSVRHEKEGHLGLMCVYNTLCKLRIYANIEKLTGLNTAMIWWEKD